MPLSTEVPSSHEKAWSGGVGSRGVETAVKEVRQKNRGIGGYTGSTMHSTLAAIHRYIDRLNEANIMLTEIGHALCIARTHPVSGPLHKFN